MSHSPSDRPRARRRAFALSLAVVLAALACRDHQAPPDGPLYFQGVWKSSESVECGSTHHERATLHLRHAGGQVTGLAWIESACGAQSIYAGSGSVDGRRVVLPMENGYYIGDTARLTLTPLDDTRARGAFEGSPALGGPYTFTRIWTSIPE